MNKKEARAIDKDNLYVDWDEEFQTWYAFGSETGFAYHGFSSEEEGKTWLDEHRSSQKQTGLQEWA